VNAAFISQQAGLCVSKRRKRKNHDEKEENKQSGEMRHIIEDLLASM
jgi:hypothetical protein